jgi:hypothetical protein
MMKKEQINMRFLLCEIYKSKLKQTYKKKKRLSLGQLCEQKIKERNGVKCYKLDMTHMLLEESTKSHV